MRKKIVFLGEKPIKSSPSLELGCIFKDMGYEVKFLYNLDLLNTSSFLNQVRGSLALILVDYDFPLFRLRQLCLARLMRVTIVKWWVGTDVYNVLRSKKMQSLNRMLSSFALNIAVAPHLVEELNSIGIKSIFIPSVVHEQNILPSEYNFGSSILIYLPTNRKKFYGFDLLVPLIEEFKDLHFIVIADDSHSLANYSNVLSLGWISDMSKIWPNVGCLLRITKHDGLPRMVISALRRKKYVIYSWPLEGCWLARNYDESCFYLRKFQAINTNNENALFALKKIFGDVPPQDKFLSILHDKYSKRFSFSELINALKVLLMVKKFLKYEVR